MDGGRWTGWTDGWTGEQMKIHFQNKRQRMQRTRQRHPRKEVPLQVNASLKSFFTCIMKYNITEHHVRASSASSRGDKTCLSQSMQNHVKAFAFYSRGEMHFRPMVQRTTLSSFSPLSHILMQSHTSSIREEKSEMRWIFFRPLFLCLHLPFPIPLISAPLLSRMTQDVNRLFGSISLLPFCSPRKVNSL